MLSKRYALTDADNPVVFFDIQIENEVIGRIIMELFAHKTPLTAENFRKFCTGEFQMNGTCTGYKGTFFHRIIHGFVVQGGDFISNDGRGSISIYGHSFEDESFDLKHDSPGLLSMANSGPNSNGCQFFITCANAPWLDGKHVVFGRVVEGLSTLRKIENIPTDGQDKPTLKVFISESGEL